MKLLITEEWTGKIMDRLTPEQRHKAMSHIRSNNTSIEVRLRKALWHEGIRYRKNYKKLPGTPDIAITKYKIAIFCDSEFFHGKDYRKKLRFQLEKGHNPDYWTTKIERNIRRDMRNNHDLMMLGWTVIRFWGLDIQKDLDECVKTVKEAIQEKQPDSEAYTDYINFMIENEEPSDSEEGQ